MRATFLRYYIPVTTFYVQNFGCRATQADGAAISRQMLENGLQPSEDAQKAEVVILNTCTVTASADSDARAAIRRVHRENPGCQILVTGCYAQRAPEEIASLPGVKVVVGNSHKHQLGEIVAGTLDADNAGAQNFVAVKHLTGEQAPEAGSILVGDIFAHTELLAAPVFDASNERTRPNLKVQDGCNNRCSFCVIPSVRGQSRSLRRERVIEEVEQLVAAGYREVVVSGINLGRWGRDLAGTSRQNLAGLIRAILDHTRLEKLRVSSVEPMDWSGGLIQLVAESPRIAKHAHVPMQSGSDAVLRRMHRKYRPWHYREKIMAIREAMPAAAIGADVMVGFPGETDAEFEETRRMVEELPLTYLHVFTYSPRPGTPAAAMKNQVPGQDARTRNRVLRDLAAIKGQEFMRSFAGCVIPAITLSASRDLPAEGVDAASTEALTDNYLRLFLRGKHDPNRWVQARIDHVAASGLFGTAM